MATLRFSIFCGLMTAAVCQSQTLTAVGSTGCSARLENDITTNRLTATIHGRQGTAKRVYFAVDRIVSLALSNDCRLAFSAELTADPILEVMEYRDGGCHPCLFAGLPYGHAANQSGGGWLPVHADLFGPASPYIRPLGPIYAPKSLRWDAQGNLSGDLHYISQFPGLPDVERRHNYRWLVGRRTGAVSGSSNK